MPTKAHDLEQFDGKKHKCPRCGSFNVALEVPGSLKPKVDDATLTGVSDSFRLKCEDCKLSTMNHPNVWGAVTEWVSLKDRTENTENDDK